MKKLLAAIFFFLLAAAAAAAQTQTPPADNENVDYSAVNKQLDKMTAELNSGKIGPGATGDMLDKINDLQDKLNQNLPLLNNDLGSVQKKIAALGEVPDDGNEPAEIAKQRKELNKQADAYKTSIAQAKLAKTKIDDLNGLILKVRNQDLFTRIFAKQSSIFHPQEFWTSLVSFAKFTFELIKSPLDWYRQLPAADMATADDNIVYALFYIIAATFAAAYLRHFIKTRLGYREAIANPDYTQKVRAALWMFLARGLIPAAIIGTFMFWIKNGAIINKSNFGTMLYTAALYLLYFFLTQALVRILLTPANGKWRIIEVSNDRAQASSKALIFSAAAICIVSFFQSLAAEMNVNPEVLYSLKIFANAVKAFCVVLVANKFLFDGTPEENAKNAATAEATGKENAGKDEEEYKELSTPAKISLAVTVFMAVSFAASLFGYIRLSEFAINRFIISGVVIAVFYILDRLLRVIFRQLMRLKFWSRTLRINPRKLVKANFWFALILKPILGIMAILTLLAVWGVSVDIMLNKVRNFLVGFNIGSLHISITSILLGIISFFVSSFLFKMLKGSFQNGSLSQIDWDPGVKNSVISGIGFFGIIISLIVGFAVMGGSISSIAIIAGALSFGAGLGLQNMVSSLVAGLTILFERQIKVGDWVIIDGQEGIVKSINMRSTELETWNKSNVIVPNASILANSLINKTYSDQMGRVEIKVGVDYNSDINKVKAILLEIAGEDPEVLNSPPPSLQFTDLGDNSLNFQLNCYTANVYSGAGISFRIREKIVERFRENNINIPYPQRVIHFISSAPETQP